MTENENIVASMEALARKWHDGQFRKGPEHLPYIVHPEAVVKQLESWGFSAEKNPIVLAIGWGHDLFEDTLVTKSEVMEVCGIAGPDVVSGITWLSFNPSNWPKAESQEEAKAMYITNLAENAPTEILAVKLADRLCNIRDFVRLCGERSDKVKSYYLKAKPLFNNIKRLPEELQRAVEQTFESIQYMI